MSKKLRQYFVLKFTTDRLKTEKYKVDISLKQARENGEVVSLGESQLIRTLQKLKGAELNSEHIDYLFAEKKKIKSKSNSKENRKRLLEIEDEIDRNLYISEIVSLVISDIRHYEKVNKEGLVS